MQFQSECIGHILPKTRFIGGLGHFVANTVGLYLQPAWRS